MKVLLGLSAVVFISSAGGAAAANLDIISRSSSIYASLQIYSDISGSDSAIHILASRSIQRKH